MSACLHCGRSVSRCDCHAWVRCAGDGCKAHVREDGPKLCDDCGTDRAAQQDERVPGAGSMTKLAARLIPYPAERQGGDAGGSGGGRRYPQRRSRWIPDRDRPTYRELYPTPFRRGDAIREMERRVSHDVVVEATEALDDG